MNNFISQLDSLEDNQRKAVLVGGLLHEILSKASLPISESMAYDCQLLSEIVAYHSQRVSELLHELRVQTEPDSEDIDSEE